jgi:uncharacterized membrane protein
MGQVLYYILGLTFAIAALLQVLGLIYLYLGKYKSNFVKAITSLKLDTIDQSHLPKIKKYLTLFTLIVIVILVLFVFGDNDIRFPLAVVLYIVKYISNELYERVLDNK